jgi:2EXR family protein
MSTSNEFQFFQALPSELRLRVWSFALSTPRDVTVIGDGGIIRPGPSRAAKSFRSTTRPPAMLHVCRESRFEGLKVYKPAFQSDTSPRYTYVAFSQDTIKACGSIIHYLRTPELYSIQKMVLDVKDPAYFAHFGMDILKKMQSNLADLELIVHDENVWVGNVGQDYLQKVKGDFLDAIEFDPEWVWPDISIVEGKTGELFDQILGYKATHRKEESAIHDENPPH